MLYALITEQLVPSASGGLPNIMSTVNLDFYMRNRGTYEFSCQLLSDALPSHDGSPE